MPGGNNILNPSEVNPPAIIPIFRDYTVVPLDKSCIRAIQPISVTGSQQVFLTSDGTALGNPLFGDINAIQCTMLGDPGVLLGVSCEAISTTELIIYIYDSGGLYGASIDVSLTIIGTLS